jgi:hypothetical protein
MILANVILKYFNISVVKLLSFVLCMKGLLLNWNMQPNTRHIYVSVWCLTLRYSCNSNIYMEGYLLCAEKCTSWKKITQTILPFYSADKNNKSKIVVFISQQTRVFISDIQCSVLPVVRHPILCSISLMERGKWGETFTTFCFKIAVGCHHSRILI